MDAERNDRDCGHGKAIIVRASNIDVAFKYCTRLAQQYQLRANQCEEAAWEYQPGQKIDIVHPLCRIMYARGSYFRDPTIKPQDYITVTQPQATQISGKGRVAMHDWLLIAITERPQTWLRAILSNIQDQTLREQYVAMLAANIYRTIDHTELNNPEQLQEENVADKLKEEAMDLYQNHRLGILRVQEEKSKWRENTKLTKKLIDDEAKNRGTPHNLEEQVNKLLGEVKEEKESQSEGEGGPEGTLLRTQLYELTTNFGLELEEEWQEQHPT